MTATSSLLDPISIGDLELSNRVLMGSMTRGRTDNPRHVPNALNAKYYAQRASAGLILSEGTWPSADAIGYVNVPGLFTDEQAAGWRTVTDAVHKAGGKIFAQLGHTGATSHPDLRDGSLPTGPSAVNPQQSIFTPEGFKDSLTPREMTIADIRQTIADYRNAAVRAQTAGFDGVELHAHLTYLIPQFLSDQFNLRTDEYGGSIPKRARFLFEVLDGLVQVWGPDRVGIKITPSLTNFGGFHATASMPALYDHVVDGLNDQKLAYLQLAKFAFPVEGTPVEQLGAELFSRYRPRYHGRIVVNGGLTFETGNAILAEGLADMVAYATPFIANPDLVERFAHGLPLTEADPATYYAGGEQGYVTYEAAS